MPAYDLQCKTCDTTEERVIMLSDLDKPQTCPLCNTQMVRLFPFEAAFGYQPFDPFYHEALDMDIHGRREQAQIYAAHGIQESGDKVGGARDYEESSLANRMEKQPPLGKTLSDWQREKDRERDAAQDFEIGVTERGSDRPVEKRKMSDLPDLVPKSGKNIDTVIKQSVDKGIAAA
jgi:putative FmdB family regulatory protein